MLLSKSARWAASVAAVCLGLCPVVQAQVTCDRGCLSAVVSQVVRSMVKHDPDVLPLAPVYRATENSHPAALGMMTLWRTVTKAHRPDFLAIDVPAGQVFLATQISEAGD